MTQPNLNTLLDQAQKCTTQLARLQPDLQVMFQLNNPEFQSRISVAVDGPDGTTAVLPLEQAQLQHVEAALQAKAAALLEDTLKQWQLLQQLSQVALGYLTQGQ